MTFIEFALQKKLILMKTLLNDWYSINDNFTQDFRDRKFGIFIQPTQKSVPNDKLTIR